MLDQLNSLSSLAIVGILIVVLTLTIIFIPNLLHLNLDPREPPFAPNAYPLIGHLLGLSQQSFNFAVQLSTLISAPIFTLQLPGQKFYVISKPHLVPHFERQHKTLTFGTLEGKLSAKLVGASPKGSELVQRDANNEGSLHHDSRITFLEALMPGVELDELSLAVSKEVINVLDDLQSSHGQERGILLYAWLRDSITLATTNAFHGPGNPFKDRGNRDAFWQFEKGVANILVSPFPSLTARSAVAAREKLVAAFKSYISDGSSNRASLPIRKHIAFMRRWDVPLEDMARFEVLAAFGFLVNTIAVSFSILLLVYMDDKLLAGIRAEVEAATRIDGKKHIIGLSALRTRCPLLLSTFQETLRHRSSGASIRKVSEDTLLDGRWLLKKGALVQLPSRVMHLDREAWGSDADRFEPTRFLRDGQNRDKTRDVAFRAFGGGRKLCPGRHLVTGEILVLVAAVVSRFDVRMAGGREWVVPGAGKTDAGSFQMQPDEDVEVDVMERVEEVEWSVEVE